MDPLAWEPKREGGVRSGKGLSQSTESICRASDKEVSAVLVRNASDKPHPMPLNRASVLGM